MNALVTCDYCSGSGNHPYPLGPEKERCTKCKGHGKLLRKYVEPETPRQEPDLRKHAKTENSGQKSGKSGMSPAQFFGILFGVISYVGMIWLNIGSQHPLWVIGAAGAVAVASTMMLNRSPGLLKALQTATLFFIASCFLVVGFFVLSR